MKALITDYLAHQRGKGLSPKTVELTGYALDTFLKWAAKHKITEPAQLDQRVLDRYNAYLLTDHRTPIGRPLSRESTRTYVRTLGSFIRWAQLENEIAATVKAKQPKAERKLIETLSREEIDRLENAAELERDKLMIRLMADTGIRLGEMLGLRASDLTEISRERYIKVRGKTGERLVPVQPMLYMRLRKYAGRGDRIFMTVRKSPLTAQYEPLRARSVQNTIGFIATKAGLERQIHPHLFRHSYATWALRKGMNPLQLQNILGHADLTMISKVYAHLTPTDAYAAMLELHRD